MIKVETIGGFGSCCMAIVSTLGRGQNLMD